MTRRTRLYAGLCSAYLLLTAAQGIHGLPRFEDLKEAFVDSVKSIVPRSFAGQALQRRQQSNSTNSTSETDVWILADEYSGHTFFDDWKFFTGADPTNGLVEYVLLQLNSMRTNEFDEFITSSYVDQDTAFSEGLAYVDDNNTVIMKGDNTSWVNIGDTRKSVRIESNKYWNGGLFLLDLNRAPWGCAVWPAFWTLGALATWPTAGEIDILEGVHDNIHNHVAWHTNPGCVLTETGNYTGTVDQTDCNANINDNSGCGISDWSRVSYGESFDAQGGGVYAMLWDETGIAIWYFYRVSIPQDIQDGDPKPKTWSMPSASLAPEGCDPFQYFANHSIVFDITFCGDWAGNSYATTPGCPGTCAERLQDPANFINASWSINSLKIYTKESLQGTVVSAGHATSSPHSSMLLTAVVGLLMLLALC
ncbi:hypothetical protein A7U60_g536 [Sanghuangporus baumii]|uniref:GH16 domain-containing protein n=1 Tax=Sanghuangporus baumii TaxID=108892 RepID=A0A9Q5NFB2_SANBA|nr:hypothetical protein A7U60_g536 [Sanghuangporus baumii]